MSRYHSYTGLNFIELQLSFHVQYIAVVSVTVDLKCLLDNST